MKSIICYRVCMLILWGACTTLSSALEGQSMYTFNYTFEDGLPSDEVYWIKEASNGLLWVGCDKGLVSFDGVAFKKYKVPEARNRSITAIYEDSNQTIWCHNFAGQIYYIQQEKLHLLDIWEQKRGGRVIQDLVLEEDVLKIESKSETWLYDIKKRTLKKSEGIYYFLNNHEKIFLHGLKGPYYKEKEQTIPFECPECFYVSASTTTPRRYPKFSFVKNETLELIYVNKYMDKNWTSSNGSFLKDGVKIPFVYSVEGKAVKAIHFPPILEQYGMNLIINKIKIVDEHTLYLATSEGLFIWNILTNTVQHFFKGKILSDSFFDQEGNLWIGSLEKGLFFVPQLGLRIYSKLSEEKTIYQIEADHHGNLLLGYDDGSIVYWDPIRSKILFNYSFPINKRIQFIIYNDKKNEYWIAAELATHIFNPSKQEFKSTKFAGSAVYDMTFDPLGNVIVAMGHGAILYAADTNNLGSVHLPLSWKNTETWQKYKTRKQSKYNHYYLTKGSTRTYSTLFQGHPEYTIWVGTTTGLRYYENGIQYDVKDNNGKDIIATYMEALNDTTFWVGTLKDGMYCIQNKKVIKHVKIDGIETYNEIQKLKIKDSILWVVSESGIVQYNLVSDSLKIWDKGNNLPSWNVLDIAFVKDTIYIATRKGLVSMPVNLKARGKQTVLKMTQIMINDSIYPLNNHYDLPYDQNTLKLQFRGISFRSQNDFRYEYRLLGVEKGWNNVSSAGNRVNYPDLNPGNYTFQAVFVKADGTRSKPINVLFHIRTPLYMKGWFIAVIILLVIAIISWIYKIQINKIKAQNKEKLERSRLERDIRISELKALKAQLNPHFMFNALNSIQDYIIRNERELASDYLGMFSDLMRLYLNHSQEGQLSLKEEVDSLQLYLELEAVRMEEDFSYSIRFADTIDSYNIEIPTMLVQPYVENAIKHGLFRKKGAKQLEIVFEQDSTNSILAIIRDNGIGRAAAARYTKQRMNRHKSFATVANNSRLELLNYGQPNSIKAKIIDLVDDNGEPLGTEVRISIPIKM